eukprot:3530157-Prymnesium_polylepis.1
MTALGLPATALPRVNRGREAPEEMRSVLGRSGPAPPVAYAPADVRAVQRLEGQVFNEFGFARRLALER